MQYRILGRTRLSVSALAYGAGPISTLMIGPHHELQHAVVKHAIESGINWFDTAATYGAGESESNLGRVLADLKAHSRVHVATKVRLTADDLGDIRSAVLRSFEASMKRLQRSDVTLLQLHNSITANRGDEPTSITPDDVLKVNGVAEAFEDLRSTGQVAYLGLTGIGQPDSLAQVIRSGRFDTMQVPYHLLNPSAGQPMPLPFDETNYGNIINDCAAQNMGVLVIRVLAGGALAGNPPSPHTLKTPFFPLALYERDRRAAQRLMDRIGPERSLTAEAIRFALAHPQVHSAIVGFGKPAEIDLALSALNSNDPPLSREDVLSSI